MISDVTNSNPKEIARLHANEDAQKRESDARGMACTDDVQGVAPRSCGTLVAPLNTILHTQVGVAAVTGEALKAGKPASVAGASAKKRQKPASLTAVPVAGKGKPAPDAGGGKRSEIGAVFAKKFHTRDKGSQNSDPHLKTVEKNSTFPDGTHIEDGAGGQSRGAGGDGKTGTKHGASDGERSCASSSKDNAGEMLIDDIGRALAGFGGAQNAPEGCREGMRTVLSAEPVTASKWSSVPVPGGVPEAEAGGEKTPLPAHFEGTNEVYIRSSAFDAIRDEIAPPVRHAFEGTNEVYIQSSAFDAIREGIGARDGGESDSSDSNDSGDMRAILDAQNNPVGKIRVQGIKVRPPVLQCNPRPVVDDANIIGIIGSGILPSVDVDKSFDMPVLDEGVMESTREIEAAKADSADGAPKKSDSLAVYASRMGSELSTSQQGVENRAASGVLGLPTRLAVKENACVHPENEPDAALIRASCARYAIDHAIDARFIDILNAGLDQKDLSHQSAIDRLAARLIDAQDDDFAHGVAIVSDCPMTPYRVLRRFLNHCADSLPNFSCYVPVMSGSDAPLDIVTALVAGRLGCMPDDEESVRCETLIRHANAIFAQSDFRWGLDILLVRYGLGHLVTKTHGGDAQQLLARNASDMSELFLNIVARDASQGPVVVVLSTVTRGTENAWRDVYDLLRKQPLSNVLVIFVGAPVDWTKESFLIEENSGKHREKIADNIPDDDGEPVLSHLSEAEVAQGPVETLTVPPLEAAETRDLLESILGARYLSLECCKRIHEKCSARFDILRQLVLTFKNLGYFSKPDSADNAGILSFLEALEPAPESVSRAFVASFDEEMYGFLAWASMLGNAFYLQDLVQIMDLEPLPDEPIWSHPLRTTWCEEIAKRCCKLGMLVGISSCPERGAKYCMIGRMSFCAQVTRLQPEFARQVHGCYAQMLDEIADEKSRVPARVAYHFESANMMIGAVGMRLCCARRFFGRFENISAMEEIGFCLSHVGPENGTIYAEVLEFYAQICRRIGEFTAAREASLQCLAYEKFIRNRGGAVCSMIACGDILRLEGSYAEAQRYLLKAVELSEEIDDKSRISDAYRALSALVFEMGGKGSLVNALRYAEKALEIRRRSGDLVRISEIQTLCARIYMTRGEPVRARAAATEAYQGLMASGCRHMTPQVLIVMAECSAALNDGLPLDYVESGIEIARKTGDLADRFYLLSMRAGVMMTTLERLQVRADMDEIASIVATHPSVRWRTEFFYLRARYDFARKNFKKTTQSLRLFFDSAQRLGNTYLMSCGYDLSAMLNLEVLRRQLGRVSREKTEKLHQSATSLFESIGAWHRVAESLRHYACYLSYFKRTADAQEARERADKVDPYCQ